MESINQMLGGLWKSENIHKLLMTLRPGATFGGKYLAKHINPTEISMPYNLVIPLLGFHPEGMNRICC